MSIHHYITVYASIRNRMNSELMFSTNRLPFTPLKTS